MTLLLQFHPQSSHRFSSLKLLPEKNRRLEKTPNPFDDFAIDWDRTSTIPSIDHATVIQKGISFDKSMVEQLPGPIYAVNWPEKVDRQDVVYVTADYGVVKRFVRDEMFPILFMETNWFDAQDNYVVRDTGTEFEKYPDDPRIKRVSFYHKAGARRPGPPTSGLACVVALSLFSKTIEVYGWDFFLTFPPARAGYWKSLFGSFVNFPMELQTQFIENAIYNWHYAYRFSELPNFVNHGYLSGLEKHPGINRRLDKIFYNV